MAAADTDVHADKVIKAATAEAKKKALFFSVLLIILSLFNDNRAKIFKSIAYAEDLSAQTLITD